MRTNEDDRQRIAHRVIRAAEKSDLGGSTLYKYMADGSLPFIKVGGRRLILEDDLRAFLERHRRPVE